ncbi:hypothetical protein ACFPPE_07415 [Agromyces tardus]|uniref:hypothetical protein n=1 Tax=Agromyces tardus TaxID=2583849 RepID=UPI00360AA05C
MAGTSWIEGPGYAIPYATELEALQAANTTEYQRAYFVPYGEDLRDIMNNFYRKPESQ